MMRNRKFHFGILSLLLLVGCFAGLFGGFRIGQGLGYAAGEKQRAQELMVPRLYQLGDLLVDHPDLITKLEKIEPQSWRRVAGYGGVEIVWFASGQAVICQTIPVHEEINTLLKSMRQAKKQGDTSSPSPSSKLNP
jgi:hypothetical protein